MTTSATVALLRRPLRAPLFIQVLALVLLSVLAAQAVNVGIVFLLPPPPPEYYTVNEAAAVLKAAGQAVHVGNGRTLAAHIQTVPARGGREWYAPREARLAESLAAELATRDARKCPPTSRPLCGSRFSADRVLRHPRDARSFCSRDGLCVSIRQRPPCGM